VNRTLDRIGIAASWCCGGMLLVTIAGLLAWIGWNGLRSIDLGFLTTDPSPGSLEEGLVGGVRGPLVGTLLVMLIGGGIALPIGVATAIFLTEYRRPAWLANAVESGVEVLFGIPSIVFALFGLAVFSAPWTIPLSSEVESSGRAYGKSFLVCGIMLSLIALPPIVRSTQEAIKAVPQDLREASFALGKSRLATVRRVLLPGARPGIATGLIIGLGRIAGDTAIIWLLLGGVISFSEGWWHHPEGVLRGTGSTLTSYISYASPVGEGNSAEKAYGAALVLMALMLVLNAVVGRTARRGGWQR
jgi:phosphate transport system permease protein